MPAAVRTVSRCVVPDSRAAGRPRRSRTHGSSVAWHSVLGISCTGPLAVTKRGYAYRTQSVKPLPQPGAPGGRGDLANEMGVAMKSSLSGHAKPDVGKSRRRGVEPLDGVLHHERDGRMPLQVEQNGVAV